MHTLPSAVLSGVLASLLLTGTAGAATADQFRPVPTGATALTGNPIYETGELESGTCPERPVHNDDFKSATNYLTGLLRCLNTSWKRQFAVAKLPFAVARLRTISRPGVSTGCGDRFPKEAQAVYCSVNKTIIFHLDKNALADVSDLWLFEVIGHEYGHHVQHLSGIMGAFYSREHRTTKDRNAASRRLELQADCLSGVFIGSVWPSLERPESDFAYLRRIAKDRPTHGKAVNYSYWLNRGFQAKAPGACNTFVTNSRLS